MKYLLFLLSILIIFSGCEEKSIAEQRADCKKQGKKFKTIKKFNFREGKHTLKGECI